MEDLLTTALEAGLGAVALIALVLLALRQQKDHHGERKDWKETAEKQFESIADLTKKSTEASIQQVSASQALRDVVERRKND